MMWLHGDVDFYAQFEFKGEMVVVDRHPLKQPPGKILVVFLNIRLLGFQKSLDFTKMPLDACVVGVLQKELLLCIPHRRCISHPRRNLAPPASW